MCVCWGWKAKSAVGVTLMPSVTENLGFSSIFRIAGRVIYHYFSFWCIFSFPAHIALTDQRSFQSLTLRTVMFKSHLWQMPFWNLVHLAIFLQFQTFQIQRVEQISSLLVIPPIRARDAVGRPCVRNVVCDSLTAEIVITSLPDFPPSVLLFFTLAILNNAVLSVIMCFELITFLLECSKAKRRWPPFVWEIALPCIQWTLTYCCCFRWMSPAIVCVGLRLKYLILTGSTYLLLSKALSKVNSQHYNCYWASGVILSGHVLAQSNSIIYGRR